MRALSAVQVRTLIQREMGAALQQYDALLCPAAPTPAYRVGEKSSDPLAMYKGEWDGGWVVGSSCGLNSDGEQPAAARQPRGLTQCSS